MEESHYEYAPLNYLKNEIRILRFPLFTQDQLETVRCSLHHVSLDDQLPDYEQYLAATKPSSPTAAVRGWVKTCLAKFGHFPPQNLSIVVDSWRLVAENGAEVLCPNGVLEGKSTTAVSPRFVWGDFEAVSYCWESDERDRHVLVDGCSVPVTENLEALLLELRHLPEARSGIGFWIDGLCINQDDVREKNHQVNLMKRIYSESLSTIIWLGPSIRGSQKAITLMRASFRHCRAKTIEDSDSELSWSEGHNTLLNFPEEDWQALLDLWSRNYFKRMWIIQELALNKALSMIMCGTERFSRVTMQVACRWAQSHAGDIARRLNDASLDHDTIWRAAYDIYSLITLPGTGEDVERVFDLARKAQVTNPRDKIYGMLGLLPPDMVQRIQPDYSKSKDEIYMEFARLMLARCERLDEVLTRCSFAEATTLPSWAPDWTCAHERKHLRRIREHKAGDNKRPVVSLQKSSRRLCVRGILFDTVKSASLPSSTLCPYGQVARLPSSDCFSNFSCRRKLEVLPLNVETYRGLAEQSTGRQKAISTSFGRYNNLPHLVQALERTLLQGHPKRRKDGNLTDLAWIEWDQTPLPQGHEHVFEAVPDTVYQWRFFDRWRHTNASFPIFGYTLEDFFTVRDKAGSHFVASEREPHSYTLLKRSVPPWAPLMYNGTISSYTQCHLENLGRAAVALEHRRLITTQTGYLGLAPDEITEHDRIAIFVGCNHPVVLRPHGDGYRYVGECYVDGLMDGEAIQSTDRVGYKIEDILLV
jgi:hypothetical protein